MKAFKGKTAVITGGAQGIGKAIKEMALFLCSDKAGFITGENVCIDGGMTKLMIYHGEHGWEYKA